MELNLSHKKKPKKGGKSFFISALIMLAFFSIFPKTFNGLASYLNTLVVPFWNAGRSFAITAHTNSAFLDSKKSLSLENDVLKEKVSDLERKLLAYNIVVQENVELEKKLSIKKDNGIFAEVISRPNITPYDTFILSEGKGGGIQNGNMVIADENIAVGTIDEVFRYSSKVRLFSAPGRTFDALLEPSNTPILLSGGGGGTYTAELPNDLDVKIGDAVLLHGSPGYIVAYVAAKEMGASDSFQKVYFRNPINIFEVKFVQILTGHI